MNITKPDFEEWVVSLWSNKGPQCTNVKEALKQAFELGLNTEQKMSGNFIGVRPNLKDWAEAIYNGTINGANKKRTILWLEEELKDIANKYYLMGFEDGDKDGWWKEQEACKHKYNSDYALFCTKCGEEA